MHLENTSAPATRADLLQLEERILHAIRDLEMRLLPVDPEPLSDAGAAALRQALDDPAPAIPHEEVLREFGL